MTDHNTRSDMLAGRVALVTGAGRGVGAAIAARLAGNGAHVAVNDVHADRAEDVAQELTARGGHAIAAAGDVTDPEAVARIVREIHASSGSISILVNNAGIPVTGIPLTPFSESDPAEWESMFRLNTFAVMHLCREVIPMMTGHGWGRIITISSDSGRTGEAQMAAYAASKAAGASLMRSLAKELGPSGVTCNALSLGTIAPDSADSEALASHARRYPVRRLGTPDDVAAAVLWLVSDGGGWTTGQTIPINGGYSTS